MKSSSSTIQIGLLQTSCSPDPAINLKKTLAMAERAAKQGAQIICTQVVPLLERVLMTMSPDRNGKPIHRALSSSFER